jgi:hypothetical protein
MNAQSKRPTEAFRSTNLLESGGGYVVVSRFKAGGAEAESGVFLIDLYCLGVKNAFFSRLRVAEYENQLLNRLRGKSGLQPLEPGCARKLVEGAVAYATRLGFAPHRDYKAACRVLGGIGTTDCPTEFTYGHEGKPFYIRGPDEKDEQVQRIIGQLERKCGAGNYHYLIGEEGLGNAGRI